MLTTNLRLASRLYVQNQLASSQLVFSHLRFYGKTESEHKYKTAKLRMKTVRPVFPAPGLNLRLPNDLTPNDFCR